MKRTGALLITGLLLMPSTAGAVGARMTFKRIGPKHTFTLRTARRLDARYERNNGFPVQAPICGWVHVHVAACATKLVVAVVDGQPAEQYTLINYVTRSGPCSNPGRVIKRTHGLTTQDGGHHYGNCFTGPLIVIPHAIY